jgi:hypothetical protein
MDTTTHPTGAAHINRETLAALVGKAGPERVRTLVRLFIERNSVWHLDIGLFLYPASLAQVTNQVTFRFAADPVRHLPLGIEDAKTWAAAWTIVKAAEDGQDVDRAMATLSTWVDATDGADTRTQAEIDFAPILVDFPESFLDATGRPDIRLTLSGYPVQLKLANGEVLFPVVDGATEDVSVRIETLERIVKSARWADALLMRWMATPSGLAWGGAHPIV